MIEFLAIFGVVLVFLGIIKLLIFLSDFVHRKATGLWKTALILGAVFVAFIGIALFVPSSPDFIRNPLESLARANLAFLRDAL